MKGTCVGGGPAESKGSVGSELLPPEQNRDIAAGSRAASVLLLNKLSCRPFF